ncbi:MAG: hypothetical protein WD896_02170 [Parcubacteria group bacterium]
MHITDSDGNPNVFNVKRNDDGKAWLNGNWTNPNDEWNLDNEIVFRFRNYCLFLPRTREAVLFGGVPVPAAEHFTYRVNLFR